MVAVVAATAFLTMLDNTVVTVAAPSIGRDLGIGVATLEWVAVGYVVAYAGLMVAGGRLADRYGRRRVLLGGMAVFTTASLAAGLAGTAAQLIVARVGQGAGAALAMPACLALLAGCTEAVRRRGTAVWMAAGAAGLALGPVVGGLLSEHARWNAIFLLNVPVGVAVLKIVRDGVAESRVPSPGPDPAGLVAGSVVLPAGTYLLLTAGRPGAAVPAVAAVALAGLAGCWLLRRRSTQPMVDTRLFRSRTFAGGTAVQMLWGLGVNGVCFFTALHLQDTLALSPTAAGLCFLPLAVALAAAVPAAGPLTDRYGAARVVAAGLVTVAAGLWLAAATSSAGLAGMLAAMAVIGVGSALTTPLATAVLADLPPRQASAAAGMFGTARELSGALGVAVVGAVAAPGAGTVLRPDGYPAGLWLGGALVLVGGVISRYTLPGVGPARVGAGPDRPGTATAPRPPDTRPGRRPLDARPAVVGGPAGDRQPGRRLGAPVPAGRPLPVEPAVSRPAAAVDDHADEPGDGAAEACPDPDEMRPECRHPERDHQDRSRPKPFGGPRERIRRQRSFRRSGPGPARPCGRGPAGVPAQRRPGGAGPSRWR